MSKVTIIAIGAGLLLISAAAAAEMYRWVDDVGEVHYSDRPTQGSTQVEVNVAGDPPAPPPAVAAEDGSDAAAPSDEPAAEDDDAQVRSQLCEKARQRLTTYQEADGIYEEDSEGGKRQLSVDERVDAIVNAKRAVRELCGIPPA